MSDSLWPHGLNSPWNSSGQNTGVGSLSLLQWIFPTQELNQGLLHCRQILYHLSYQGSHHIYTAAATAAKSRQSCLTLCDPINGSPPGSPIPGILQARTLEWVAISFSNAWKWKVKVKLLSRVQLLATPWTAAYRAPPSMGFSRQEYWSGVALPVYIYTTIQKNRLPTKTYCIAQGTIHFVITCKGRKSLCYISEISMIL